MSMLVNNVIFLTGIWGMLFAGKPENHHLLFYYLALNSLVMTAWGIINFFFGGWIELGELIVSGQFESKLATPRHPLLLVATHTLHPAALGDLLMGVLGIILLFALGPEGMGTRTLVACALATVGFIGVYVFSGSLAFFFARGNMLTLLVREITLSLSGYPMGKIFPGGMGRILLLLTPAAAVSILPVEWIESGTWTSFGWAVFALIISLFIAKLTYNSGVRRFQSISLVTTQS